LLEEARTERVLWQEFCAHDASLSAALTEALSCMEADRSKFFR
jgi:hypothetical protein